MDKWWSVAIGAVAGFGVSYAISYFLKGHPALWLIDRIKWWRLETGRTNSYSGGIWAFNRELDVTKMINRREHRRGGKR
jgi:hypothetical protein